MQIDRMPNEATRICYWMLPQIRKFRELYRCAEPQMEYAKPQMTQITQIKFLRTAADDTDDADQVSFERPQMTQMTQIGLTARISLKAALSASSAAAFRVFES